MVQVLAPLELRGGELWVSGPHCYKVPVNGEFEVQRKHLLEVINAGCNPVVIAPSNGGDPGTYDPGDIRVYFDNALI